MPRYHFHLKKNIIKPYNVRTDYDKINIDLNTYFIEETGIEDELSEDLIIDPKERIKYYKRKDITLYAIGNIENDESKLYRKCILISHIIHKYHDMLMFLKELQFCSTKFGLFHGLFKERLTNIIILYSTF